MPRVKPYTYFSLPLGGEYIPLRQRQNGPDGAHPAETVKRWNGCARNGASVSSGAVPGPPEKSPAACAGMFSSAPAATRTDKRPEQQRTTRRLPWSFSFCPSSAPDVCRTPAGTAAPRPDDHAARTMTTPTRCPASDRRPPAPADRKQITSAAPMSTTPTAAPAPYLPYTCPTTPPATRSRPRPTPAPISSPTAQP